jgi:hypothetical protein
MSLEFSFCYKWCCLIPRQEIRELTNLEVLPMLSHWISGKLELGFKESCLLKENRYRFYSPHACEGFGSSFRVLREAYHNRWLSSYLLLSIIAALFKVYLRCSQVQALGRLLLRPSAIYSTPLN